jgi:hypothetical protein
MRTRRGGGQNKVASYRVHTPPRARTLGETVRASLYVYVCVISAARRPLHTHVRARAQRRVYSENNTARTAQKTARK